VVQPIATSVCAYTHTFVYVGTEWKLPSVISQPKVATLRWQRPRQAHASENKKKDLQNREETKQEDVNRWLRSAQPCGALLMLLLLLLLLICACAYGEMSYSVVRTSSM